MKQYLDRIEQALTIPAAEYVPAIGDVFDIIKEARASINSVVCEASHPMQDGYIESMLISSPELGHRLWIDYATREQADVAQAWLAGETPPPPGSARDSAEADKTKAKQK